MSARSTFTATRRFPFGVRGFIHWAMPPRAKQLFNAVAAIQHFCSQYYPLFLLRSFALCKQYCDIESSPPALSSAQFTRASAIVEAGVLDDFLHLIHRDVIAPAHPCTAQNVAWESTIC